MTARRATALLAVAAVLGAAPAARADGDPASDVLLFQDAYLPYFPAPSEAEADTLLRMLDRLEQDGYPLRVAVVADRADLGAYPELLGRPADYARLLESELRIRLKRPRLLVVMAAGLAHRNLEPAAAAALADVEVDPGDGSDGLVRTAIASVARVATAAGHPTEVPEIAADPETAGDGASYTTLYVLSGAIALLGVLLIALAALSRARRAPG